MAACAEVNKTQVGMPSFQNQGPICCKQQMQDMVRRAILRSDGTLVYCCVWHCVNCGRLLL